MSGYRNSSYDPRAYERPGRPLRPFNGVQWTGVALEVIGLGLFLLTLAGKMGFYQRAADIPATSGIMLMLVGIALINSRREPAYDPAPELAPARKRWTIIVIAISAIIIAAAAAIDYLGA